MFKRSFLALTGIVSGLFLGAASAMAAPITSYTDLLSDNFTVVVHYQGSVDNPVRTFGETFSDQLEKADLLKPDEQKVMELAQNYFLKNDLLFVADVSGELTYLAIPMAEAEVDGFVEIFI